MGLHKIPAPDIADRWYFVRVSAIICPGNIIFIKKDQPMSLFNQKNKKDKKKENKKSNPIGNQGGSKFIQKPKTGGFVSKQSNTGSQRGS